MVEVVALLLALVIVPLTGGSFHRLARLEFDAPWLLFAGLGIQVVLSVTEIVPRSRAGDVGVALLLGSYVLILAFGLLNLRITGMAVVTVGIALNVLVITLNQGMPYRAPAGTKLETTVKHRPERAGDVLTVLDDRIIVPGPLGESASFGDLIIAAGLIDIVYRGSRPRRRRTHRDLDDAAPPTHIDLVAEEAPTARPAPVRARTASTEYSPDNIWPRRAPAHTKHPALRRHQRPAAPLYESISTPPRSSTRSSAASTRGSYTYPGPE